MKRIATLALALALATLALALALALAGCAAPTVVAPDLNPGIREAPAQFEIPEKRATFSSDALVQQFESEAPKQYVIGPGDKITVIIAGRPELSGQH
ncbi:MAG: polysaccharide biosynthesis/export family protein, partial [Candidatus Contendobacter sp.]|nr:polysaccharide biosynthesis/export family protein [Candidatus Contendobacter sp.]